MEHGSSKWRREPSEGGEEGPKGGELKKPVSLGTPGSLKKGKTPPVAVTSPITHTAQSTLKVAGKPETKATDKSKLSVKGTGLQRSSSDAGRDRVADAKKPPSGLTRPSASSSFGYKKPAPATGTATVMQAGGSATLGKIQKSSGIPVKPVSGRKTSLDVSNAAEPGFLAPGARSNIQYRSLPRPAKSSSMSVTGGRGANRPVSSSIDPSLLSTKQGSISVSRLKEPSKIGAGRGTPAPVNQTDREKEKAKAKAVPGVTLTLPLPCLLVVSPTAAATPRITRSNSIPTHDSTFELYSTSQMGSTLSLADKPKGMIRSGSFRDPVDDVHGSVLSLASSASSTYSSQIRKLRRELESSQEKVATLTSQLSANANLVAAFEQSLVSMTSRLRHLAETAEEKDTELLDLRETIDFLKKKNSEAQAVIQGALNGTDVTPKELRIKRQNSSDSISSLNSITSHSSIGSSKDADAKKKKKKSWVYELRSSFNKAFSIKKGPKSASSYSDIEEIATPDSQHSLTALSLDVSPMDAVSAGTQKDELTLRIVVRMPPQHIIKGDLKQQEFFLGWTKVSGKVDWKMLDEAVCQVFKDYITKMDPASTLGLSTESVYGYSISHIKRILDTEPPELPLCRRGLTSIVVTLKGLKEKCVDSLVFETLIPKPMMQHYISLLLKHRRLILSGPSGTGKTYLTNRLAEYLVERSGRDVTEGIVSTFNMHQQSCKDLQLYLSNLANQIDRETGTADVPLVILLDDLSEAGSISELVNGALTCKYHKWASADSHPPWPWCHVLSPQMAMLLKLQEAANYIESPDRETMVDPDLQSTL
ncbi:neuron navigator 1 [Limosa lapponica baueri]|uniref:Neuron navigator 1 n=1 Tax=Limosa lapponica baueri TaxID=1758121 RepID=A0A2I0TB35_LIMLA|nr:neuron navigator 1 [Limosa lapponica baueri]